MSDKDEAIQKIVDGIKELLNKHDLTFPSFFLVRAELMSELIIAARAAYNDMETRSVKRKFMLAITDLIKDMDSLTDSDCQMISRGLQLVEKEDNWIEKSNAGWYANI